MWLLGFIVLVPLVAKGRKSNEKALRAEVKTTNRYAKMSLDDQSRSINL